MPSGKRSPRLPELPRAALRTLAPLPALAALAALLGSCYPGAGFERTLRRLDAGDHDAARASRLLDAGARRARSSSDWLRLLSRAFLVSERTGNPSLAALTADRARKAYPTYEDIALAACRAYIDAGRPGAALSLFPAPLDPALRPSWFAEAFLEEYRRSGRTSASADEDVLLRVAEASGRGEPAVNAALLRMRAGDREGAAWFLRRGIELGAAPDPDLAWDAGVLSSILSDPERALGGRDLERRADAALLLGERDWAREYLTELVLADPAYSWKAYASLAALEDDLERADYWYDRMASEFPSEPEAFRARAAHLARTGRVGRALEGLESEPGGRSDPRTAVLAAEIGFRIKPGEPRAAKAIELANTFPAEPYVQTWALGTLAAAERFAEAAEGYRQVKSRGMDLGRPWYLEALSLILEGRSAEAAQLIERDGPAEAGPEAPFALGVLYSESGDHARAAERFRIAASAARDAETRARALTEAGKEYAALGDRRNARDAWAAALAVKPDHAEALRLLGSR